VKTEKGVTLSKGKVMECLEKRHRVEMGRGKGKVGENVTEEKMVDWVVE